MARAKRNLIVKRNNVIVNYSIVSPKKRTKPAKPSNPVHYSMSKTEQRLATPMPVRADLTQRQWIEWGDGLKVLNHYGVKQADCMTLGEQRELISTIRCNEVYFIAKGMQA